MCKIRCKITKKIQNMQILYIFEQILYVYMKKNE